MKIHMRSFTILFALLLLSGTVLAATVPYRLDWYVLTGSGGGRVTSTNYQLNFTVGQTVISRASGTNYRLTLGYWAGLVSGAPPGPALEVYLPVVLRNH